MSRLDSFIRRLSAQRDCLNQAAAQIETLPGWILEVGLGNGRTYDHLRTCCPTRRILVFDRQIGAHPDCIPPESDLRLGDFRDTIPAMARDHGGMAILIHADLGSGDKQQSLALATALASDFALLLKPGGLIVTDQPLPRQGDLDPAELPPTVAAGRYFIYRKLRLSA